MEAVALEQERRARARVWAPVYEDHALALAASSQVAAD